MQNTIITFEGNLAADPEIRFTPSGKQLVEFTVLVNRRRQNEAGGWVDDEPTRHACKAFKGLGENICESVGKGDRVLVAGNMVTDSWTDKETDEKRTRPTVLVDAIGPSLRWASAAVKRTGRATAADRPDL